MLIVSILLAALILALAIYLFGRQERSAALGRNASERPMEPPEKEAPAADEPPPSPVARSSDDAMFERIIRKLGE